MASADRATVTRLLRQAHEGVPDALNELFPLVYEELRALAHAQRWRWSGDDTLGTTALVHEAYIRLVRPEQSGARSRAHFMAIAAKAIRQILCNYARDRNRQKRGGGVRHVALTDVPDLSGTGALPGAESDALAALESALVRLEELEPRLGRVVECRFYGDMSIADTAAALDISPATVKRDWSLARAWLYRELQ